MRYECERCGSIFIVGEQGFFEKGFLTAKPSSKTANKCPCGEGWLIKILDFETPEQYKDRIGKAWPDNRAVYWRYEGDVKEGDTRWYVSQYHHAIIRGKFVGAGNNKKHIVCATEAGQPPDDWRPEEGD
jgi:DNA-directed RNA polymerase subunit RPC12/RpoP